mgnify:CR=1 FL=1
MLYDLSKEYDAKRARIRLDALIESNKTIELKEKRKKRTVSQNAYMHVLFGIYGSETGYTAEEAKITLKRACTRLMIYEKNGDKFLKGTSELSKDECQFFIDWIINFAAGQGIHLPSADEYIEHQYEIQIELDRNCGYI